jgi:lipopolysaccharide exporter
VADTSLGTKTLRIAFWAYGSYVAGRLLVLASVAILARVLVPEDFGLVALALTFTALLETVNDFGLSQALIVSKEEDVETKSNTVFFYGLAIALGGALVIVAIAPLVARFFDEPDLLPLVMVLSLNFPLRALGATHEALAMKSLNFRARTAAEICDVTVRGLVGIVLALLGFGAWSLVLGLLAGVAVWSSVLWRLIPWRPRLRARRSHAKELFKFGGTLTGVDVLHGLTTSADSIIIGRVLGATSLGLYSIGFRLPQLAVVNISMTAGIVLFPAYTKVEGGRLRSAYLQSLRYTLVIAAPLAAGLIVMADPIVLALFGDQWGPSAAVMQIISLYALCLAIEIPGGTIFKVTGRASILLKLAIPRTIALFGLIAVVATQGINAVAWTLTAVTFAFAAIALLMAARIIGVRVLSMGGAMWPPTLAAVGAGVAMYGVLQVVDGTWPSIIAGAVVGGIAYVALLWLVARESLMYLLRKLSPRLAALVERPGPAQTTGGPA